MQQAVVLALRRLQEAHGRRLPARHFAMARPAVQPRRRHVVERRYSIRSLPTGIQQTISNRWARHTISFSRSFNRTDVLFQERPLLALQRHGGADGARLSATGVASLAGLRRGPAPADQSHGPRRQFRIPTPRTLAETLADDNNGRLFFCYRFFQVFFFTVNMYHIIYLRNLELLAARKR